jgi:hypothetical protein
MRKHQFRVLRLIILFATLGFNSFAQNSTLSPYSKFGIGDLTFKGFTNQRGMAGLSFGFTNPNAINFNNPASYSYDSITVMEIGVNSEAVFSKQNQATASGYNADLNSLALAFPVVKNKVGFSFGIIPFSSTGYNIVSSGKIDTLNTTSDINYIYKGSGGYTKYYVGAGFKLLKSLSVGVNASYLFGNVVNQRKEEFTNSILFNTNYQDELSISDFYFEYGLNWKHALHNDKSIAIGITGSPSQKLSGEKNILWLNYKKGATGFDVLKDTVLLNLGDKGDVTLPSNFGLGFCVSKLNKWNYGADFSMQNWSEYQAFEIKQNLKNSFSLSIGGSYIPSNLLSSKFFSRVEYRMGAYYNQSYLNINNNSNLNDLGLSMGVGLPLKRSYQSKVNCSLQLGERGTLNDNLVRERYIRLSIGLTFNEVWFQKKKFD